MHGTILNCFNKNKHHYPHIFQGKTELRVRIQGCVQYRNSLQTFRNSRVLEIGNFAKRLQTFRYLMQPRIYIYCKFINVRRD